MRRLVPFVTVLALAVGLTVPATAAGSTYEWIVCDPSGGRHRCISRGPGGTTLELSGHGRFAQHGRWADGGGTFTVRDAARTVLERGRFRVTGKAGFWNWGAATPDQVKFVREVEDFALPPGSVGGKLKLRAVSDDGRRATLKILCLLGSPAKGAKEGVSVTVFGLPNFSRIVDGATLFVRN